MWGGVFEDAGSRTIPHLSKQVSTQSTQRLLPETGAPRSDEEMQIWSN